MPDQGGHLMSSKVHTCPGYLADPPELQRAIDDGGYWLACEHPERPVDRRMVTIAGCRGCDIAAEASDRHGTSRGGADTVEGVLARLEAT